MMSEGTWAPLRLKQTLNQSLLIKYTFNDEGYACCITDLSSVWTEYLDKRGIIRRAAETGSSVDPAEDDSQFYILLEKVKNALTYGPDTSLEVCNVHDSDSLRLYTSSPLPTPLPPLRWELRLEHVPTAAIEEELVLPTLTTAHHYKQQIQQLKTHLKDKDHVIARLADKLELSNTDLTTVFPGVSNIKLSRKKSQRSQLARHVQGLEEFDEKAWEEHQGARLGDSKESLSTILEVLRDVPTPRIEASLSTRAHSSPWWQQLPHKPGTFFSQTSSDMNADRAQPLSPRRNGMPSLHKQQESMDEFQVIYYVRLAI